VRLDVPLVLSLRRSSPNNRNVEPRFAKSPDQRWPRRSTLSSGFLRSLTCAENSPTSGHRSTLGLMGRKSLIRVSTSIETQSTGFGLIEFDYSHGLLRRDNS
jgi:hypothetical protein